MYIVPEKLKRARRPLDGLPQVLLLEDWCYNSQDDRWYIKIQIEVTQSSQYISKQTSWYVVVDAIYPFGNVKIYPSIEQSITATFPHQENNAKKVNNGFWRSGNICTTINNRLFEAEPYDIDSRLLFHVKRAIFWLEDAVYGKLISENDLFELPSFNTDKNPQISVVFCEDAVSYMQWEDIEATCGTVVLSKIANSNMTLYRVDAFYSLTRQNSFCVSPKWGCALEGKTKDEIIGVWIKLPFIPVVNVWQAPTTIFELREACHNQGIDLLGLLKNCIPKIRDNKRHILLIGFPIPKYHNGENEIVFWQALLLPYLSFGKKTHTGFRPVEAGWWLRDKSEILKDSLELDWLGCENWSERDISLRGQMSPSIRRSNITFIGCGSLGATITELLVRSGAYKIQLIDHDVVKVGNLSRHILSISDVGCSKSKAVADRLNAISPHAIVSYSENKFYSQDDGSASVDISKADIVIDCTGEDSVLNALSEMKDKKRRHIISLSIGLEAKRIYVNMQYANKFQYHGFFEVIRKYLKEEEAIAKEMELPRDGIGCWHPTFPARADDVSTVAALAIKLIETYVQSLERKAVSLVFEQDHQNGFFTGYKIVEKVEHE